MKHDLSNELAAGMSKSLSDNKEMFSTSAMLEKLAFKRVSDQDEVSELEVEMLKTASCCECGEHKKHECKCECHKDTATEEKEEKKASRNPAREAFNALLKVSEDLESCGFEKLAAASILLANKLIVEAKAKTKAKKSKESDKEEKSKSKSKDKKVDMKERMEKMRAMQKGKKKDKSKTDKKKS